MSALGACRIPVRSVPWFWCCEYPVFRYGAKQQIGINIALYRMANFHGPTCVLPGFPKRSKWVDSVLSRLLGGVRQIQQEV